MKSCKFGSIPMKIRGKNSLFQLLWASAAKIHINGQEDLQSLFSFFFLLTSVLLVSALQMSPFVPLRSPRPHSLLPLLYIGMSLLSAAYHIKCFSFTYLNKRLLVRWVWRGIWYSNPIGLCLLISSLAILSFQLYNVISESQVMK